MDTPPSPRPCRPDTSTSPLSAPLAHQSRSHRTVADAARAASLRSGDSEPSPVGIQIRAINSPFSAPVSQPLGPPPLTAPSNPGLAPPLQQGSLQASSPSNFYHPFAQFSSALQARSDKFGRPYHYKQYPKTPMAAIHQLPIELVARIFTIGVQDQGEPDTIEVGAHRFEVLVSHVCQYWRHTALSTPSLWTTIFFRTVPHMTRAREYLVRSKEHLLDIDVDTCSEKEHEAGYTLFREEFTKVFAIVVPQIDRWLSLTLKVRDLECKAGARKVLSQCGPAKHLQRLKLWHIEDWGTAERLYTAIGPPPVVVFNGSLPSLRSISLIGVNLPWVNSPFLRGLTSIELALHSDEVRIPYNLWYTMLSQSPNLVELSLHYSGPKFGTNGGIEWSDEKITLPKLKIVKLRDMDNPTYFQRLFERLSMPKVKVLSLETPSDQDFTPFIEYLANPHKDEPDDDSSHSRSTSPEPNATTTDDVPESSASPTSDIHPQRYPYSHSHSSTHSPSPSSPLYPSSDPAPPTSPLTSTSAPRKRRKGPVFPLLEELTIEKLYCTPESFRAFLLSAPRVRYLEVDPSNMTEGLFEELTWKGEIDSRLLDSYSYSKGSRAEGDRYGLVDGPASVAQGSNGSNGLNGSNGTYGTHGFNDMGGRSDRILGDRGDRHGGVGIGNGANGKGKERAVESPFAEDSVYSANVHGAYPAHPVSASSASSSGRFTYSAHIANGVPARVNGANLSIDIHPHSSHSHHDHSTSSNSRRGFVPHSSVNPAMPSASRPHSHTHSIQTNGHSHTQYLSSHHPHSHSSHSSHSPRTPRSPYPPHLLQTASPPVLLPNLQTVRLRGLPTPSLKTFILHRRSLFLSHYTVPITKWILEERIRDAEMLGWMEEVRLLEVNPPRPPPSVISEEQWERGVGRELEWDGHEAKERIEWFKDEDEDEEEELEDDDVEVEYASDEEDMEEGVEENEEVDQ